MATRSYWQSYRKIKANVADHLAFIQENNDSDTASVSSENATLHSVSQASDEYLLNRPAGSETSFSLTPNHEDINESAALTELNNESDELDNVMHAREELNTDQHNQCEQMINNYISDESDGGGNQTDSDDEHVEDCDDLNDKLAKWSSHFNISHSAIHGLLTILHPYHPDLPKDPRTLLHTNTQYTITEINGGSYYHFGIGACITKELMMENSPISVADIETVSLQINIDGLPLFKSSSAQFWPILGKLSTPFNSKPFIIGLYLGNSKPVDVHEYLHSFVVEMKELEDSLLHIPEVDHYLKVVIQCIICDAPAKAYVKQVKGHSGYYGCDKCQQKGVWQSKITFPEVDAPLRTDVQFDEMLNEEHHLGPSPFRTLSVGMVSQFPMDYMHLVCLGVVKRLILLWMKGPIENSCRMGSNTIRLISDSLLNLRTDLPREFLRKGRSLYDVDRWKATEFRQFLLYTGPVVLKDAISLANYKHFMLLSVGIYCLSSPFFCTDYCDYANEILCLFVRQFGHLYGQNMYVYNVHCIVHLAKDVAKFGPLDDFSAFVFESFLGKIKRSIRKPTLPLAQVIRRLSEKKSTQNAHKVQGTLKKQHTDGPVIRQFLSFSQYKGLELPGVYISVSRGDNCIMVGDKVGLVRNILSGGDNSETYVVFEEFRNKTNFFSTPLDSSDLRIFAVSQLSEEMEVVSASNITGKCVILPFHNKYISIPLLHVFGV